MQHSTVIPRRLSGPELRAVRHLLTRSALADTPGRIGRLQLTDDGDLYLARDLEDGWRWSGGELVLLDVVRFVVGEPVRWPDLSKIDDLNRQVVREAVRMLAREGVA